MESIGRSGHNPALLQIQIFVIRTMKEMWKPISKFAKVSHDLPFQSSLFLEKLEKLEKELAAADDYEIRLADACSFPLNKSVLKWNIGNQKLKVPLHIYLEDYEDGKHVSCFEIPQVYGCGASEGEALAMLDREIVSMIADLDDGAPLSLEFQALKIFLDIA